MRRFLIFVLSPILLASAAEAAPPVAQVEAISEKTTLSSAELQDVLGITAWRIRIPASFGDRPCLLFEHYVEGDRKLLMDRSWILSNGDPREVLVTSRLEGANYHIFDRRPGGSLSVAYPAMPRDMQTYDFGESTNAPEITDEDIVLMRVRYYKKDDPSVLGSPRRLVGEVLLRVAKAKNPRPTGPAREQ